MWAVRNPYAMSPTSRHLTLTGIRTVSNAPSVHRVFQIGILRRMASSSVNKITGQHLEKLAMAAQK